LFFFFIMIPPPSRSILFPYTTLFRSKEVFRQSLDGMFEGRKMNASRTQVLRRRIRLLTWLFIVGLVLSGATAIPLESELGWLIRSEEHTSELQSRSDLVCRLLLEKKK